MKIEIDIPEMYVPVLSRWASVGRTLDTAEAGCAEASIYCLNDADQEKYGHCADELMELKQPLDVLHKLTQTAIWEKNRGSKMILILKEVKYKAKWRRPEHPPVPGDIVYCCWDYFKVVTVIQRPFQGQMQIADLEVKPIGPIEPMFLPVYERGGFYVAPLQGD